MGATAAPHRARGADSMADSIMDTDDYEPPQDPNGAPPLPPGELPPGILPDEPMDPSMRSLHQGGDVEPAVGEGALNGVLPDDDAFLKSISKNSENLAPAAAVDATAEEEPPSVCFLADFVALREQSDREAAIAKETARRKSDGEEVAGGDAEQELERQAFANAAAELLSIGSRSHSSASAWEKLKFILPEYCEVADLTKNKLDDEAAKALGHVLTNTKGRLGLKWLNLDHNLIGQAGATALTRALATHASDVTRVSLGHNNIGNDGAKAFRRILGAKGSTLTHLRLHSNNLGPVGAQHLGLALEANPPLMQLDVSENDIGQVGFEQLARGLRANTNIKHLNLGYAFPGDNGIVALAGMLHQGASAGLSQLQVLQLAGNNFGAKGCQALGSLLVHSSELKELHIDDIKFEDQGDETVLAVAKRFQKDVSKLTTFDAGKTNLNSRNIVQLARYLETNTVLQRLYLNGNSVGDEGAKAFSRVLASKSGRGTSGLQDLDLSEAEIGVIGARALLSGLKSNRNLLDLQLDGNSDSIPDTVRNAIDNILEGNRRRFNEVEAAGGWRGDRSTKKSKSKFSWAVGSGPSRTEL